MLQRPRLPSSLWGFVQGSPKPSPDVEIAHGRGNCLQTPRHSKEKRKYTNPANRQELLHAKVNGSS